MVTVHAGHTRCTLAFDPVTLTNVLGRNRHLVRVERNGTTLYEEIVEDSPLHTAVHEAITNLFGTSAPPPPDLVGLRRIAAIAEMLHAHRPAMAAPL